MPNLRVNFKGHGEFIVVDTDKLEGSHAITTPVEYARFGPSYAHLFPSGEIKRYRQLIGHREDLEILGTDDTEIESLEGITSGGWKGFWG
jgi:hypothetical protein